MCVYALVSVARDEKSQVYQEVCSVLVVISTVCTQNHIMVHVTVVVYMSFVLAYNM